MDDLRALATLASRSYWEGSAKTKINLAEAMTNLRCELQRLAKLDAAADTARITKPQHREHA